MDTNITSLQNLQISFPVQGQNKAITGYPGGKAGAGTFQAIICQIPPISVYIEPFIGGGGVFHNLRLPVHTVINDYDSSVMDKYRDIQHPVAACSIDKYCLDYRSAIAKCNYKW